MTTWSRVTLVGERRKVDAVLPAEEPIGELLPDVLQMLGEPVRNPAVPLHISTAAGDFLDSDATLQERDVSEGSVLRVVRADDPLPAPVVHEVPEAVGASLDSDRARWTPEAARWSATAALVVLVVALATLVRSALGDAGLAAVVTLAVLLTVSGAALGGLWRASLGTALSLSGGATGGLAVLFAADAFAWPGWARWGGLAIVAALLILVLGLTSRLGRGGLIGGGVALFMALLWVVSAVFGLAHAHIAALVAVACSVLLGLLLRIALSFSGLTALDDHRSEGADVATDDVRTALANTHRGMAVSAAAVAVSAAAAGIGLATDVTGWTIALAALLAVVVGSRSRMFPLTMEKVPLIAATLVIVVALAVALGDHAVWGPWAGLGLLLASLVTPAVALAADPPLHVRARLRRITDRIEAVAVVAVIPVAIGVFGTYQRLLTTF